MPIDRTDEIIAELRKTIGEDRLVNLKFFADHRSGTTEAAILSQLLEWVKDESAPDEVLERLRSRAIDRRSDTRNMPFAASPVPALGSNHCGDANLEAVRVSSPGGFAFRAVESQADSRIQMA